MTGNHSTDGGFEPEPEFGPAFDEALRSRLRAHADLVTITAPPIAAVRRRAQRRLRRRSVIQGVSGLAATCAVVAGIVAWSPGREPGDGVVASGRMTPAPAVSAWTTSASASVSVVAASGFLHASDLGPGWKGPIGSPDQRTELALDSDRCESAGVYQAQVPVTPAPDRYYEEDSPSGTLMNGAWEAIYTFTPGTGPVVMGKVRTALITGCGEPQYIKVLASPATVADEAIVFTVGGDSRNLLVRSGDRVASAVVNTVSAGQDGMTAMDALAKQMATRLIAD